MNNDTPADAMKLLPCPFCGNDDRLRVNDSGAEFWVSCDQCEAEGPPTVYELGSKAEAIAAWNTWGDHIAWATAREIARRIDEARSATSLAAQDGLVDALRTAPMESSELVEWLMSLAEEHFEMLGDIHKPLTASADHITALQSRLDNICLDIHTCTGNTCERLVCVLRRRMAALEGALRSLIASAYDRGATDVHDAWIDGKGQSWADFGEAACDYTASIDIEAALASIEVKS